jgi:hypothetical protein
MISSMEKYTNQFKEAALRLLSAQPGNKRTANPNLRMLLSPTLYHVTAWLGRINSMVNKALQECGLYFNGLSVQGETNAVIRFKNAQSYIRD